MKTLVVLLGPTGVGKTELCLSIAEHFNIPIINADSRQIFSEIPIGTAAPTAEQQKRRKHYFVGTHHLTDYYSAAQFEEDVMNLSGDLFNHADIALMSGGSMMYIDAVCNGIDDIPTVNEETRELLRKRHEEDGDEDLLEDGELDTLELGEGDELGDVDGELDTDELIEDDGEAEGELEGEFAATGENEAITPHHFSVAPLVLVACIVVLPAGVTAPSVS